MWIGHLSKLTQQEELSDIFTKYGDIVSIDMIHPRGCAFLVMHRRQDAYKAIDALNGYKLHGRVISISWAAGKGVKSKQWKDYWDLELGVSYIPWDKLDQNTDFEQLEDGGMFDEDSMPAWLKEKLKNQSQQKDTNDAATAVNQVTNMAMFAMDQPPPTTQQLMTNMSQMVPPFPMGSGPVPRFMPPMMTPGLPLGVPPPGVSFTSNNQFIHSFILQINYKNEKEFVFFAPTLRKFLNFEGITNTRLINCSFFVFKTASDERTNADDDSSTTCARNVNGITR